MTDLLTDALPTVWHGRRIDPDFRHMVRLSAAYSHGEVEADPVAFALQLCGQFYTERFSAPDLERLWQGVIEFYRMGEQAAAGISDTDASPDTGPAFDYRCDAPYIVAAFQQAYGIDLTTAKLHWFRFRALFAALPEDTFMAKIINWRTLDLADYEGSMREHYAALKERFALPPELRGGAAVAQTVAEHDAAFLARFRRCAGAGALPLLRQAPARVGGARGHGIRRVGQMQKSLLQTGSRDQTVKPVPLCPRSE